MVSERDKAKLDIADREGEDPELDAVLSGASKLNLETLRETNRHKEEMRSKDLGKIGGWLGGREMLPFLLAALILVSGVLLALVSMIMAAVFPERAPFWGEQIVRGFAFAGAAGAFLAGRSGR